MNTKCIESITIEEIRENPVWKFTSRRGGDETRLTPVRTLPCSDLNGKVVGTQVTLANGSPIWAFLGNIDTANPELTKHFMTISVERDGMWFHLARYHDYDYEERGPKQLASFLGIDVDEVFPIQYDIRSIVKRDSDARTLMGAIEREPKTKLTRAEIIALAVP